MPAVSRLQGGHSERNSVPRFHLLDQRSELTQEEAFIQLGPEVLERYVGVYELSPEGTVTVTRTDTA
jgi:hypothetical protein